MIYKQWMKYIKDDVKLTEVIMPGTHNAGSYGMLPVGCCQDGTFYSQFAHGVRHFCIRYCGDKKKGVVLSHGPIKGATLAEGLTSIRRMIEDNDSEFFIFDIREYYNQKIGPISLTYPTDDAEVTKLIEEYLAPEKYAYTDFEHVSDITFGDIRRSGKRYLIINYRNAYQPWCKEVEHILPWNPVLHGKKPEVFAAEVLMQFNNEQTNGIYWFQTQLTPVFGLKMKTPRALEKSLRPYYQQIIDSIAANKFYLESANVISGDFMTEDYSKCREIIKLNLLKGTVKEDLREEFEKELNEK